MNGRLTPRVRTMEGAHTKYGATFNEDLAKSKIAASICLCLLRRHLNGRREGKFFRGGMEEVRVLIRKYLWI